MRFFENLIRKKLFFAKMVFWILSFRESSFSNNYSQIFQKELSETGSEKKGKKKLDLWLLCILKKRKSLFNTKRSRRAKFEKKKIFWRASSPEIWKNCSFFIISIWLFFKFFFIVIFVFLSWISEDKYEREFEYLSKWENELFR